MIYLFDEIEKLDDSFIEKSIKYLPKDRYNKAIRYKHKTDKLLCIISYLLLYYGLKNENIPIRGKLTFDYNKYGKPYLLEFKNVFFNLSHCKKGIVCAISSEEIGVDIQNIIPYNSDVAERVCTENELSMINSSKNPEKLFCMLWTLKESYIKAIGTGLSTPLKEVSFYINNDKIYSNKYDWNFKLFNRRNDYCIAVCSRTYVPKDIIKVSFKSISIFF